MLCDILTIWIKRENIGNGLCGKAAIATSGGVAVYQLNNPENVTTTDKAVTKVRTNAICISFFRTFQTDIKAALQFAGVVPARRKVAITQNIVFCPAIRAR
ncbi:hypothetical protein QFB12_004706, partial [Salmonella enterica]|nr:hypothetical protein [Salmonella enterica]